MLLPSLSLASLLLATGASAAPLASLITARQVNSTISAPQLNITYQSNYTAGLPKTLIMATGGTIAGSSASSTDSTNYRAGSIGVAALVEAVPELLNVSNIYGMQVANVGSPSVTDDIVLQISKLANLALCSENAEYDGVVVTHGTDTLEETAFTLDITLTCDKPVVVVGAMRPSTALSADGPNNLISAVTVAVTPSSRGRGVLVVLNDRICQAWYCAKRHANALDTFQSPEQGFVGYLLSIKPFYYYPPSQPSYKKVYDISAVESLPRVDMLIAYQGVSWDTMNASIAAGAKGFVTAGVGSGGYSGAAGAAVASAIEQGSVVVRSTKINNGAVLPSPSADTISAGLLNPVKARRMLQILLALGKTQEEIKAEFEDDFQADLTLDLTEYY
ncbi:hypothetical protein JCM6882_008149 [Rhodosporidiobolus microsporus]